MDESEKIIVLCTVPDPDVGATIAGALVEAKLAACVNIIGGLRSIYLWKGEVEDDPEALLVVKSRRDKLPALEQRIVALHPYDVPEVIATPIIGGLAAYLGWIDESVDDD